MSDSIKFGGVSAASYTNRFIFFSKLLDAKALSAGKDTRVNLQIKVVR